MLDKKLLIELETLVADEEWNDENTAFIKQGDYNGKRMWIIYNAEGEKIAATDNRDFAFIVAKQNEMEPHSVH